MLVDVFHASIDGKRAAMDTNWREWIRAELRGHVRKCTDSSGLRRMFAEPRGPGRRRNDVLGRQVTRKDSRGLV